MGDSLLVIVLAAIGGAAGIGAFISAVYRARSGQQVDEADAADKIVNAAAHSVQMMREDIIDCRATAARAELRAKAAEVATELCEHGREQDRKEMTQQSIQLAVLSTRLMTLESTVGTLPRRKDDNAADS